MTDDGRRTPLSDFSDEERFLLKKALSRLSVHDDTPKRLCDRLCELSYRKQKVSRESCVKVVRFLHAEGLLSEKKYASDLVSALKSRGYGRRRILNELRSRKFSSATLCRVAEELAKEEQEELDRAFLMLSRRAAARKSELSDHAEKSRLYAYLLRLGYDSEIVKEALDQLTQEEE